MKTSIGPGGSSVEAVGDAKSQVSALYGGVVLEEALELRGKGEVEEGNRRLWEAWSHAQKSDDAETILQAARAITILGNPMDYDRNYDLFRVARIGADTAESLNRIEDATHLHGLALVVVAHHVLNKVSNSYMIAKMSEAAGDEGIAALYRIMNKEPAETLHRIRLDIDGFVQQALNNNHFMVAAELLRESGTLDLLTAQLSSIINEDLDTSALVDVALERFQASCSIAEALREPFYLADMLIQVAKAQARANRLDVGLATLDKAAKIIEEKNLRELKPWLDRARNVLPQLAVRPKPGRYEDATEEEKQEFLEHVVRKIGRVNLDDSEDEMAWILRIGLRDRNPERVLRYCEHLEWAPVSWGLPGSTFGLPTAGIKILYCPVVEKAEWGHELDNLKARFADGHCVGCPERSPRAADWSWNETWQEDIGISPGLQKHVDAFRNMGK